ncbi:HIG1 domain-containing protein [Sporobolomyces koalae]|uniref:HIG1 domain-containing protein n=1 Tax=Sporobolomyces koalae TaxID=500713 RepID=UPI00317FA22B
MPRQYIPDPVPEAWSPEVPPPPKTGWAKFSQKFKEEPLVPIACSGCLATVVALLAASSALQKGNREQFNKMLRYRVAAQGVTVIAALGGSVYFQSQRRAAREAEQQAKLAVAEAPAPTPSVQA